MNIVKRLIPVSLLVLCSSATLAWGAEPAPVSPPKAAGPVIAAFGPVGTSIAPGQFPFVLNYSYCATDGVRNGSSEVNDNIKMTKNVFTVKFRYGIMEGLDIRTATPVYDIEREDTVKKTSYHQGSIGDTTLVLHKQLMDQAKDAPFSFALDLGMVLPTSDVNRLSNDALGNNAWGAGGGVGLTYTKSSHRLDQELNYYSYTEGSHNYRKGNRFRAITAWGYAATNYFDIGAESLFEMNGKTEKSGKSQNDAKSEWYAGPKVAFKYKPAGFTAGLAALFPMARWYEANTPSDGFRIELRLTKNFNLF